MNDNFRRHNFFTSILFVLSLFIGPLAYAAGGTVTDPTGIAPDRYVYYPGTEALAEGEMRIIACGTGMPDQRQAQASACFLFELGNGDKFIFDTRASTRLSIRRTASRSALSRPFMPAMALSAISSSMRSSKSSSAAIRRRTNGL